MPKAFVIAELLLHLMKLGSFEGLLKIPFFARLQGTSMEAYWNMCPLMQRRRRVKRQSMWYILLFPCPLDDETERYILFCANYLNHVHHEN